MGKGGARLCTTRQRAFSGPAFVDQGQRVSCSRSEGIASTPSPSSSASAAATTAGQQLGGGARLPLQVDGATREELSTLAMYVPLTGGDANSGGGAGSSSSSSPRRCCGGLQLPGHYLERFNSVTYILCAITFVVASFGFLPRYKEDYYSAACYAFAISSGGFLWVSFCDAAETLALHRRTGGELPQLCNCCMYILGSLLFLVGSFLFLPGATVADETAGAVGFIVGSVFFTLAALLNVTEVRRNTDLDVEHFKLCTTVLYFGGGILFVVGSVFFLPSQPACLLPAGAWLFVAGSVLYLLGAGLNMQLIFRLKKSTQESSSFEGDHEAEHRSEGVRASATRADAMVDVEVGGHRLAEGNLLAPLVSGRKDSANESQPVGQIPGGSE